jgi:hypothetical protein
LEGAGGIGLGGAEDANIADSQEVANVWCDAWRRDGGKASPPRCSLSSPPRGRTTGSQRAARATPATSSRRSHFGRTYHRRNSRARSFVTCFLAGCFERRVCWLEGPLYFPKGPRRGRGSAKRRRVTCCGYACRCDCVQSVEQRPPITTSEVPWYACKQKYPLLAATRVLQWGVTKYKIASFYRTRLFTTPQNRV